MQPDLRATVFDLLLNYLPNGAAGSMQTMTTSVLFMIVFPTSSPKPGTFVLNECHDALGVH